MNLASLSGLEQRLVWDRDYGDAAWWVRVPIGALRTLLFVAREFASGDLTLRAMSLVYTTILSLVPLLAFSFSILKGFGVQNQIEPLLLQYLAPLGDEKSGEITARIVEFVDNIDVRVLGAVGLGLLVYTIITLMQKIEHAFNAAWHLHADRSFTERFTTFISALTVGPLLIFAALAITGSLLNNAVMDWLTAIGPIGTLVGQAAMLVPYLLVIGAFTFLYLLVPNARVRPLAALAGGVVAGLLWESAGFVFAYFVRGASKYQAIYATFATAMFFMIWLYLSWLILLVGASAAYYVQHPHIVIARARRWRFNQETFEHVAMVLLARIVGRHYARHPPFDMTELSAALAIPPEMLERVIDALESAGFVRRSADEPPRFLLAVPPEQTPLTELVLALRRHQAPGSRVVAVPHEQPARTIHDALERATTEALGARTLKDLYLEDAHAPGATDTG